MRRSAVLLLVIAALLLVGCGEGRPRGVWALRWMERPSGDGPSTRAAPEDIISFAQVATYDHHRDRERAAAITNGLVEGDVIAYWMSTREARRTMLTGRFSSLGYRLLVYGHLAMVVADPERGGTLRLFSSESFKGPNSDEDLASLGTHSFDVFRLDRWDRVDTRRLHEFVVLARAKANRWFGYDFSGMFGLWNSPLRPARPRDIGHDYICSTVVVAALHYAGVALDAVRHGGFADVCTPKQVVTSKGCIVPPPAIVFADLDLPVQDVGPKGGRAGR